MCLGSHSCIDFLKNPCNLNEVLEVGLLGLPPLRYLRESMRPMEAEEARGEAPATSSAKPNGRKGSRKVRTGCITCKYVPHSFQLLQRLGLTKDLNSAGFAR